MVSIPPMGSRQAYLDMVDFASSVGDARAAKLLERALEGRGAFRRFRDGLGELPELREQWFEFARLRGELRAIEWVVGEGYASEDDGDGEAAARTDAARAVLEAIGGGSGVDLDEAAVRWRWREVQEAIDAGRSVTIVRDGRPWAIISPP
jgi:hypothetical protein